MNKKSFEEAYKDADDRLRKMYYEMAERGEITEEDAEFMWFMARDEILWYFEDEDDFFE